MLFDLDLTLNLVWNNIAIILSSPDCRQRRPTSRGRTPAASESSSSSMSLIPQDPAAGDVDADKPSVCTPHHCFHAFDALYCALTDDEPVPPKFPDDK